MTPNAEAAMFWVSMMLSSNDSIFSKNRGLILIIVVSLEYAKHYESICNAESKLDIDTVSNYEIIESGQRS